MIIKITDTVYEGYGIGRDDKEKIVFVERAVEGDTVEVEIIEHKKNFSFAKIKNIVSPSEFRITPECKYANLCGGCLFAHIDYKKQLLIKEKILRGSLRKFIESDIPLKIFSHCLSNAENKKDYRLRASFVAENGEIGFYGFKSKKFVAVKNCVVIKKSLFNKASEFAYKNNIDGKIYIIETDSGKTLVSVDAKSSKLKDKCQVEMINFNGKIFGDKESFYNTDYGKIGVGCDTFFQANRFLLNTFQKEAVGFIEENKENTKNILELYAGSGFFTAGLIKKSENVFAYEIDYKCVSLAKKYAYPVEKSDSKNVINILDKNKSIDTVFLDPPREGVSKEVVDLLIKLQSKNIIYVSCNPMTLSRDINLLDKYYKIKEIKLFDMFIDTYHIESAILLERK